MLFGTILLYLGIGLIGGSISALLLVALFSALLLAYVKLIEERELEARFGKAYLEYRGLTPFLLPRFFTRRP